MATGSLKACKETRTVSTALCAPAVRMLVVSIDKDDGSHAIRPVVALRTTVRRTYTGLGVGRRPNEAATDRGMLALGWEFEGEETRTEPLFIESSDLGVFGTEEAGELFGRSTDYFVYVCPWPQDQDEERLAEAITALKSMYAKPPAAESPAA